MKNTQAEIKALKETLGKPNKTPEENKALCEKYPFLKWYGDPLFIGYNEDHIDYNWTWEDELPDGWKKAFCPKMWNELKRILVKHNYLKEFRFTQIKEKYGQLRIYFEACPEEVFNEVEAWASKYEDLSENVCIDCGRKSKYMTLGWITFVCKDCAKNSNNAVIKLTDLDAYYNANMDEKQKFIKRPWEEKI